MQSVHPIEKGSNIIPHEIIQQCRYYRGLKKKNDTDVTIIVGKDQLLVMRFHQIRASNQYHSKLPPPLEVQRELYGEITKRLKKGGFEAMRFGGSNGLWKGPTESLYKFLHYAGNLPRKAFATKLVPLKRSILAAYIKTSDPKKESKKESSAVCYEYSIPVPGGSFQMPASLLAKKKYDFLIDFIEYRLLAALIIDDINSNTGVHEKIQPAAVSSEIEKMAKTARSLESVKMHKDRQNYQTRQTDVDISKLTPRKKFLIQHSTLHCKYTLVAHPVGMHRDTFGREDSAQDDNVMDNSTFLPIKRKKGDSSTITKKVRRIPKYSLENKICFIDHCSTKGNPGRGGKGSTFVWALLDW